MEFGKGGGTLYHRRAVRRDTEPLGVGGGIVSAQAPRLQAIHLVHVVHQRDVVRLQHRGVKSVKAGGDEEQRRVGTARQQEVAQGFDHQQPVSLLHPRPARPVAVGSEAG